MKRVLGGLFCLLLALSPAKVFGGSISYYRSAGSGDWNAPGTWEVSFDGGSNWSAAGISPTSADETITIRNGHTVTITEAVTYDQVVVDAGGQVTVASGFTHVLADGTGTDLVINGTWLNSGDIWTTTGTWSVGAGGTYIHNTGTSGSAASALNTASLDAASTFIYRRSVTSPSTSISGRTYGNLRFDTTSSGWSTGATGNGTLTVNGDFYVAPTVNYSTTMTNVMTFAGNFTIDGTLSNNSGTQIYTFTGSSKTISGAAATIGFEDWNVNSGASIINDRALNCSGNLSVAGTLSGSGAVNFSKAGAQTFTMTSAGILGAVLNFTVNSGSTTTLSIASGTTTVGSGVLTVASGGALMGNGAFVRPIDIFGTVAPGNSVKDIETGRQIWRGGGSYIWEINDANGTAGGRVGFDPGTGSGWDFLLLSSAGIDILATSGSRFTINVASLSGSVPGGMANFNNSTTKTWTIASAKSPQTVTNFAAGNFAVDYSSVSNDLAGGAFSVVQEPDDSPQAWGPSVRVKFTPNQTPVALSTNYVRTNGASLKISITNLLATRTSDPDGQARLLSTLQSVAGFMMSTNGFTLSTNGTDILYQASTNNAQDTFDFVVRDDAPYRVGDTIRYATNTITITTTNAGGVASNFVSLTTDGGGTNTITFAGIPGYTYDLQKTEDLTEPIDWTVVGSPVTANGAGRAVFVDPMPGSPAFYRVRLHE